MCGHFLKLSVGLAHGLSKSIIRLGLSWDELLHQALQIGHLR